MNDRIEQLNTAVQALLKDDFSTRISAEGDDKVAELARSLEQLSRQIETHYYEHLFISRLTARINAGMTLESILNFIFDSFRAVLPYDRISYAEFENENRDARVRWVRSQAPERKIGLDYVSPVAGSSLQELLETAEPCIINDLEAYIADHPQADTSLKLLEEGMHSMLLCPLFISGKAVGVLYFASMQKESYLPLHISILRQIADQIAVILEKARIHRELLQTKKDLEEANARLNEMATVDALTRISNRRRFDEHLQIEWRRCLRDGRPLTLMLLDIDYFKGYNDHYGHQAGDACLLQVAQAVDQSLRRANDFTSRYGGEEFAIVISNCDTEGAYGAAEVVRQGVESLRLKHESSPIADHVTISVGFYSLIPHQDIESHQLLAAADKALYKAKKEGRNRIECGWLD